MLKKTFTVLATLLVLVAVWQIIGQCINDYRISLGQTGLEAFIPLPSTMVKVFINNWQVIFTELSFTLGRALGGFILGTCIGFLFAVLLNFFPFFKLSLLPIFYGINSFPIMGFAPAIILIFGQGSSLAIIVVSALICFFPTLINVDSAFRHSNQDMVDFLTILKATKWQKLIKIQLPHAIPNIFLAMRISIPASIIGATMGEWLGTRNGIGQLITVALYQLKPGLLFVSLFVLTIVTLLITGLLFFIEKKFLPWKYTNR